MIKEVKNSGNEQPIDEMALYLNNMPEWDDCNVFPPIEIDKLEWKNLQYQMNLTERTAGIEWKVLM